MEQRHRPIASLGGKASKQILRCRLPMILKIQREKDLGWLMRAKYEVVPLKILHLISIGAIFQVISVETDTKEPSGVKDSCRPVGRRRYFLTTM